MFENCFFLFLDMIFSFKSSFYVFSTEKNYVKSSLLFIWQMKFFRKMDFQRKLTFFKEMFNLLKISPTIWKLNFVETLLIVDRFASISDNMYTFLLLAMQQKKERLRAIIECPLQIDLSNNRTSVIFFHYMTFDDRKL